MGQGKIKKSFSAKIIAAQPYCIYCGGETAATTIDHIPPRAIFDQRLRPQGLEFPACGPCNSASRVDESVAALLSRCYQPNITEEGKAEVRRLMDGVRRNVPGLVGEFRPTQEAAVRGTRLFQRLQGSLPPDSGLFYAGGPLVRGVMERFAAKIGFALHYRSTGRILPAGGAVGVTWYTNTETMTSKLPEKITEVMGPPETLMQGAWNVGEQFQYKSVAADDLTLHTASFRKAFLLIAFGAEDERTLTGLREQRRFATYRPGWLLAPPGL